MLIPTNNFRVTPQALMFDPELYIFDFSPDLKTSKFLLVEEKKLVLSPFIDIRFEPLAQGQFTLPTKELLMLEKMHQMQRPKSAFIFHHAFVCSTLLARCLNQIDAFFSLKEPWILRRLADYKRSQGQRLNKNEWSKLFTCYLGLLAKNYHSGSTPVIKVTNVANNLLSDVLQYLPDHKCLYLYSDLNSFLISNLKKPVETQVKMPALAASFLVDSNFSKKHPQYCNLKNASFLQVCALIWVINLYNFKQDTEKQPSNTVRSLEMNTFLTNMDTSLKALCSYFGHQTTKNDIEDMLHPEVIHTNAKQQHQPFDNQNRLVESEKILGRYASDISKAKSWVEPILKELQLVEYCQTKDLLKFRLIN